MSLNLPIEDIKASGEWIPNYGHGLGEKVRAKRNKDEYKRNFDLELEGAANICSVLSETKGILDWYFIEVYFTNKYEIKASDSKKVSGVVRVTILRETLRKLQENKASTLNNPTYWHLVHGYGDYSNSLYHAKKNPCVESLAKHKEALENIVEESKNRNLRIPPGVCAELGYLYAYNNNTKKAIELFQMEKQTYPESTILMERLIMQAENRASDDDSSKKTSEEKSIEQEKSIGGSTNE